MSKLFINALVFGVSIQIVAYLFWAFSFFGSLVQYPFGSATDLNNLNNMFSLNWWTALIGGTGIAISIAALLLRQGTYALYALLLFGIGVFFNVVKGFVLAIPNTVAALIPNNASTNPLPPTIVNGVAIYPPSPFQVVAGVILVFAGFMYMFGLVIQRETT